MVLVVNALRHRYESFANGHAFVFALSRETSLRLQGTHVQDPTTSRNNCAFCGVVVRLSAFAIARTVIEVALAEAPVAVVTEVRR